MRILIISQYFWPEQFRVNELSKFLQSKNLEIDILTGLPNYPDGKLFPDYKKQPNTWDYQWIFSVLENNGLSVSPAVNLIENIGFSDDATHTKTGFTQGLPTEKDIIDLKSLPAPTVEEVDRIKDDFVFKKIWHTKEGNVCFLWRLKKLIRRRYKTKKMIKEITHIASI